MAEHADLSRLLDGAPAGDAEGLRRVLRRARWRLARYVAMTAVAVLVASVGVGYGVSQGGTSSGTRLTVGAGGHVSPSSHPAQSGPHSPGSVVAGPDVFPQCPEPGVPRLFTRTTATGIMISADGRGYAGNASICATPAGVFATLLPGTEGVLAPATIVSLGGGRYEAIVVVSGTSGATDVAWTAGPGDHMRPVQGEAVLAVPVAAAPAPGTPMGSLDFTHPGGVRTGGPPVVAGATISCASAANATVKPCLVSPRS